MKTIVLAKKSKRILARLIDFLIVLFVTLPIFTFIVFPSSFDAEKFEKNSKELISLYKESGLFAVDENGSYTAYSNFTTIVDVDDLFSSDVTYNGKEIKGVSLTKTLYEFYTTKYVDFGGEFNLTHEAFETNILKLGKEESNIKDFDVNTFTFTLIDDSKSSVTFEYFLNAYTAACTNMIKESRVQVLTAENQAIMSSSIQTIVPVLLIVSFIFDLLIPLFLPHCQSIGKKIFDLCVLNKNGYHLNKFMLLPRWLVYVLVELILGFLTFGASILITYTMFLFVKKRRCLHDMIAGSVVIERSQSIFFANQKEETFYINRQRSRGVING